jgi:hypothetical protein
MVQGEREMQIMETKTLTEWKFERTNGGHMRLRFWEEGRQHATSNLEAVYLEESLAVTKNTRYELKWRAIFDVEVEALKTAYVQVFDSLPLCIHEYNNLTMRCVNCGSAYGHGDSEA